MTVFFESHHDSVDPRILWEISKTYLRRCIKSSISYTKRQSARTEAKLAMDYAESEATYIANPTNENQSRWLGRSRLYLVELQEKA